MYRVFAGAYNAYGAQGSAITVFTELPLYVRINISAHHNHRPSVRVSAYTRIRSNRVLIVFRSRTPYNYNGISFLKRIALLKRVRFRFGRLRRRRTRRDIMCFHASRAFWRLNIPKVRKQTPEPQHFRWTIRFAHDELSHGTVRFSSENSWTDWFQIRHVRSIGIRL